MAFHNLFGTKGRGLASRRRRRKTEAGSALLGFLETNRVVAIGVFVLTVAAIFTLTFVGVSPSGFQILPGQIATIRISAETEFSYESKILTERKRERLLMEVPPVYEIDRQPLLRFEAEFRRLMEDLDGLDARWPAASDVQRLGDLTALADTFSRRSGFKIAPRDLVPLMALGDPAARSATFESALFILREIHSAGIFDPENPTIPRGERELTIFQVKLDSGETSPARIQSLENALQNLRINLTGENVSQTVSTALYHLLRPGVRENIVPDTAASQVLRARIVAGAKPEIRAVMAGESIVEPGREVTPEQYEMLAAYQKHLNTINRLATGIDERVIGRILLVVALIVAATIYVRLEDPMTLTSNGRLGLLALVMVFSLSLVRATFEIGNSPWLSAHPEDAALLPYIAPTIFAPMVIAVLIGASPALFSGIMISVVSAIIFGNRLDILVISLVTASVAAFSCRSVRRRSQIVRAGWFSGLVLGVLVLLLLLTENAGAWLPAVKAAAGGQLMGVAMGVLVLGLLPMLEALFKRTTDITLLELTDYNHPLLRRMQMDAPGTYHHSLMVANLAENAAVTIGANALLCRVCSMFHDIGKLVKPEYFSENQRGGVNPHADRSPHLSALVIKSHVKEGLDLAITHKLPRPVIDVVRQHHGTTLIRYFYEAACRRARGARGVPPETRLAPCDLPAEGGFRYDGPKPQFKESAIILFADSIEAASRSLQKVTPQAVEELVDGIVREKIDDGQADEAPLTIREIADIRRSFTHTLLNALHSRVVYPKTEQGAPPRAAAPGQGPEPAAVEAPPAPAAT
jgi:hypothetical protein